MIRDATALERALGNRLVEANSAPGWQAFSIAMREGFPETVLMFGVIKALLDESAELKRLMYGFYESRPLVVGSDSTPPPAG